MKKSLGPVTLIYPLPVLLLGTYDAKGQPNIMTAAWGGICCSEPPCLAVSVRKARWSYESLIEREAFTISIPSASLCAQADFAGIASGRNGNKFELAGLKAVRSELVDAPYVGDCPLILELELRTSIELGTHVQFIGTIVDVKADEACIGPDGTLDCEKVNPISYDAAKKEYRALGQSLGKAYTLGKQFMKQA